MLLNFFAVLRSAGVPTTVREMLDLLKVLEKEVVFADMDDFYHVSRSCLVKDERWFDRFDTAFEFYFEGIQSEDLNAEIPHAWLENHVLQGLTQEQLDAIEKYDNLDELMKAFQKRLEEQEKRHEGGNRWIGTGGTSAFGNSGYHPSGIRIGGNSKERRGARVWEKRQYRGLDGDVQLGIRNTQMALRRLRRFARQGKEEELDIKGTIRATAHDGGLLNVRMMPPRRNSIKVLLFLDVGGSMDPHVRSCEELFSAARLEFKYLEHFYFHNFIYDSVWRDNRLHYDEMTPVEEIIRRYGSDYKVIFVGDASMSPYEISAGSVDSGWDSHPQTDYFTLMRNHYRKSVWLNPVPRSHWDATLSVGMIRELMEDKMYPMSMNGLEEGIAYLSK